MEKDKRLICIADPHCGHRVGLCPPKYQWQVKHDKGHIWNKFARIQKECWKWYEGKVKELMPADILVLNGDAIDGRGERSGGVELITGDRNEQVRMAAECIEIWQPKQIVITRGTPYHTGEIESWEDVLADFLKGKNYKVKIGDHEWIDVNGVVFDFKHFVGASVVPYGRKTTLSRDVVWNELWAEAKLQPRADWIIRSHVHYCEGGFTFRGSRQINALITPALQAMGTRHGARKMSGLVDFGLVEWNISEEGNVEWQPHIAEVRSQAAKALVV